MSRRSEIKRKELEGVIELAVMLHKNLLPIIKELRPSVKKPYVLTPIEFTINYADPSNIPESDPRCLTYKLRRIFGPD